jgi:hypothetical protein
MAGNMAKTVPLSDIRPKGGRTMRKGTFLLDDEGE